MSSDSACCPVCCSTMSSDEGMAASYGRKSERRAGITERPGGRSVNPWPPGIPALRSAQVREVARQSATRSTIAA
jgi:hypothetical protein